MIRSISIRETHRVRWRKPTWVGLLVGLLLRVFAFLATVGVCLSAGAAQAQVDCSATGTTGVPQIECEGLMALYAGADGTNWTDNSNWDTATAVDTWFGVVVAGGRVAELSLGTNQLTGTIPPELGNLSNLTSLHLESNQLTGAIPLELGNLSNLISLWLQDNQLAGPLPVEVGNLANLTVLYLWNNELTGPVPPELSDLSNLSTLHLGTNQLTGTIPPELGNLSNLIGLYLSGNQLTGTIPPELGNLSNLTALHLSGNQLTGPIPPELENLSSLTALYLYGNQLTGPIPSWIGNLTNLTTIYLGTNQLTGALPPELGNLTNLVSLFVYGNQITGPIPPEFGNLTKLTTLYMPSSQLTGPIPPELGNLASLGTLYLSNNQLTGPIPPELGNLSNLTTAYLHSNQLTGSIPPELGDLANLSTLFLYGNQLTGTIPSELGNLSNLTSLNLSSNQLAGDIPDWTALPLTTLNFGSNAFTFADFESEFVAYNDGAPATFNYSPQATVDTARTVSVPSGASALLPSAVAINPSGNDQYQWYKDGAPIPGPEGTSRDLDVTLGSGGVAPADAGAYRYTITNSVVTGLTLTSQVITVTVSATCGDGFLNDPSEVCDDGNLTTGDGCNAACLLEVGEPCTDDTDCASNLCNTVAIPPVCAPPVGCGNGALEAGEACDDGNTTNGDGCTDACKIEDGNPCATHSECASGVCDTNEAPPVCEPAGSCGNGVSDPTESCDDGNLMSGDGCNRVCLLEDGEPCTEHAQCESTICDLVDSNTCELANSCGNGAVEAAEACDDGNLTNGDGCSNLCLVEDGAPCTDHAQCESTICDTADSNTCEPANRCGNGTLEAGEVCDDGNASSGDGCGARCLFEVGAGPCTHGGQCGSGVCNTMAAASVCAESNACGNGVLDDNEVCDDGNLVRGDGCSQLCTLESDWRGGGGCSVRRDPEGSGAGWILSLLMLTLIRQRRDRAR